MGFFAALPLFAGKSSVSFTIAITSVSATSNAYYAATILFDPMLLYPKISPKCSSGSMTS